MIYMAPEVALHKEYTKSVDIWPIGIIMYKVLSQNYHPIFEKGIDTVETFKKKLEKLNKVEPPNGASWLAQNLFDRLMRIQSLQRYTAKEALTHPWITRQKEA